jgi:hypothetical protein
MSTKTSRRAILAGAAILPAIAIPTVANSLTAVAPTTMPKALFGAVQS